MSGEAPNPHLSSASQWSSSSPRVLGGSPKPRYFICRPDNTLTPLIALDELHPSVRIAGIPRTLMPNETASMVSLGVQERSLGYFYVETIIDSGSSSIKKPEKDIVNTAAVPVRNGHDGARDDDGSGKVEEWRQGISSLNQTQVGLLCIHKHNSNCSHHLRLPSRRHLLVINLQRRTDHLTRKMFH